MGHFRGENPWVSIDEIVLKDMADLVGAEKSEVIFLIIIISVVIIITII